MLNRIIQVVDKSVKMTHVPEWFRGCRLNFAENLLKFRDNKTALICTGFICCKIKIMFDVKLAFLDFGILYLYC